MSNLPFAFFRLVVDVATRKRSKGDSGMWQPRKIESDFSPKLLNRCQCQMA